MPLASIRRYRRNPVSWRMPLDGHDLYRSRDSSTDYARAHMSNHSAIRLNAAERFSPEHAFIEPKGAVEWRTRQLATPFEAKTVVVTHHEVSPE